MRKAQDLRVIFQHSNGQLKINHRGQALSTPKSLWIMQII